MCDLSTCGQGTLLSLNTWLHFPSVIHEAIDARQNHLSLSVDHSGHGGPSYLKATSHEFVGSFLRTFLNLTSFLRPFDVGVRYTYVQTELS